MGRFGWKRKRQKKQIWFFFWGGVYTFGRLLYWMEAKTKSNFSPKVMVRPLTPPVCGAHHPNYHYFLTSPLTSLHITIFFFPYTLLPPHKYTYELFIYFIFLTLNTICTKLGLSVCHNFLKGWKKSSLLLYFKQQPIGIFWNAIINVVLLNLLPSQISFKQALR